ncbi:nascent polypeptide associated complex subunit alpha [Babesia caballi]|uniref:Nascent polypeptide associated complex subunit alpha n=1 Tax=Babesia caballi TaxID=5871 RepID=A0AAV4LM04_BABCB|nr:nascent polypeptide associated complex subunit alpha [Babesia caballi]
MPGEKEKFEAVVDEPVAESGDDVSSEGDSDVEDSRGVDGDAPKGRQNKNERKSRKLLGKLGLKPVEGISKVCIKKSKQVFFVVHKPDVYKLPNSDTYVVFGEAKVDDMGQNPALEAAQRLSQLSSALHAVGAVGGSDSVADTSAPAEGKVQEDVTMAEPEPEPAATPAPAQADDMAVDPNDVELVMTQVGCTREQAVQSLLKHGGDIVESIMDLSS